MDWRFGGVDQHWIRDVILEMEKLHQILNEKDYCHHQCINSGIKTEYMFHLTVTILCIRHILIESIVLLSTFKDSRSTGF